MKKIHKKQDTIIDGRSNDCEDNIGNEWIEWRSELGL